MIDLCLLSSHAGATSYLVAPDVLSPVSAYCATTRLDLADWGPDPALLRAWAVNR
jgi:hypothetical protein